jgi:hypothetical protein
MDYYEWSAGSGRTCAVPLELLLVSQCPQMGGVARDDWQFFPYASETPGSEMSSDRVTNKQTNVNTRGVSTCRQTEGTGGKKFVNRACAIKEPRWWKLLNYPINGTSFFVLQVFTCLEKRKAVESLWKRWDCGRRRTNKFAAVVAATFTGRYATIKHLINHIFLFLQFWSYLQPSIRRGRDWRGM